MKNNYIVDGKKVVDIILKPTKRGPLYMVEYFLLEDGSEVKAKKHEIQIQCRECGNWYTYKYVKRYEKKDYVFFSCRLIGEKNPFYGRKHSSELKERLSNERKGVWCVGENNPMYGKSSENYMTPEAIAIKRKRQSEGLSGEKNGMFGKNLKDFMTKEKYDEWIKHHNEAHLHFSDEKKREISKKLSLSQKRLKEADPIGYSEMKARAGRATMSKAWNYEQTTPEKKVEQWLKDHKVDYDYSPIMGFADRCFQYDFIVHGKRILIEVHGDYWHGNPNKYNESGSDGKKKLNDIQKKKIERDALKAQFAKEKNFKLICIWEDEINNEDFSKL